MEPQRKKSNWFFLAFLFGYHMLFTVLTYRFFKENGGDASFYWLQHQEAKHQDWFFYFDYGSHFLQFLNYPLVAYFGWDISAGFFIYSCVGFLGIVQFYRLLNFCIEDKLSFFGINFLSLVVLLPNLHFWTAMLGKEALCFLFLTTILLQLSKENFKSVSLGLSLFFLIVIRPHIALMLFFSIYTGYLFFGKWSVKIKIWSTAVALLLFSGLFYMFLQLSKIKRFDWERIQRFNEYSLLSFKDSGTYVPIIEYSYPYKVFTFFFRPLWQEVPGLFGLAVGIENLLVLFLHIIALLIVVVYYRKIDFPLLFKIILCFAIISGVLIVQRYSGFGIFARTKIMIQPFVLVVVCSIIAQFKTKIVSR
ncbi:hypothetical protein [Flavobacterium pedocola]